MLVSMDNAFNTIAARKGNNIITLTPVQKYRVINGQAIEIDEENN